MNGSALPIAHAAWFTERIPAGEWAFLVESRTLLYLAIALALAMLVRALAQLRDGVDVPMLARLAPWMPFALRLHIGISLIGLVSAGAYLAPSLELATSPSGFLLGFLMIATAVLLVTGYRTRLGAALLVASGPLGMLEFGVWPVVQRVDLLGLAIFLVITGPGRWSADHELGRANDPSVREFARAAWALRVFVGAGLIAAALAEKLANPELAQRFLDSQAIDFNVLAAAGLPVSDLEFIRIAGAAEVLLGLLLIFGAPPQAVALAVAVPFNATLYFFGTIELLGHLPVYGAMLVLLVFGSHPELRASWRPGPPRGRAAYARARPVESAPG